jgi:L-asparaginase II
MDPSQYEPLLEVWRGGIVESLHQGAIAVVDPHNELIGWVGDPELVTYLRSTAKPFQALPFVELGGVQAFHLTERELAILCASHDGTDEHVAVLEGVQKKIGVSENDLQCGVHLPYSKPTQKQLARQGLDPTPNRHNCSGKHTGMLALARLLGAPRETYLENDHPVQKLILKTFGEMVDVPVGQIVLGIDGCSAPVFAVPLRNAALGLARLADPSGLEEARHKAIHAIIHAMQANPDMVSGPGGFDTIFMTVMHGKAFSKGGAEGFLGLGLLPGLLPNAGQALGIAIKVADGDISGNFRPGANTSEGRVRSITAIETLRQLGALSPEEEQGLAAFAARPQFNWRKIEVGKYRLVFKLHA